MPTASTDGIAAARVRCLLWPTDFSPFAREALPYACWLAGRHHAKVIILHVLTPAEADVGPGITGRIWGQLQLEGRKRAQAQLDLLAEDVRAQGIQAETVLGEGVAFQEILRIAARTQCDLILMATHGRTGLRHILLGSVAGRVLRRAACPVFVVRPTGAVPAAAGARTPERADERSGRPPG